MDSYIKDLLALLDKKQERLDRILCLTQEQTRVIDEENIEGLENYLGKKQTQIDEIDAIDNDFNRIYNAFKEKRNVNGKDNKEHPEIDGFSELKQRISKIMDSVKEILKLEESNSSKAKEIMRKYSDNLKNVNQTKKINSAYGNKPIEPQSYFFDRKK